MNAQCKRAKSWSAVTFPSRISIKTHLHRTASYYPCIYPIYAWLFSRHGPSTDFSNKKRRFFGLKSVFFFIAQPIFHTPFLLSKCILFLIWLGLLANVLCWLTGLDLQRAKACLPFSFSKAGVVCGAEGRCSGYKSAVWKCQCLVQLQPTIGKTQHPRRVLSARTNALTHPSEQHVSSRLLRKAGWKEEGYTVRYMQSFKNVK